MKIKMQLKRMVSLLLCLMMIIGFMPADALAASADSVVIIAASDYQLSNSGTIMTNIMNQIKEDYGTAYGVLMGGDYDAGSVNTTANHIKNVDNTISGVFPEIASENRIYIQGNHENYAGLKVDGTNLLDYSGAHDTDYYGVYVINHDDFPWTTSSNPKSSDSLVQSTADALGNYLDVKVAESYEKPIFVTSHLPLHATTRGDNQYARYIFNELEAAGEAGLNIIFLVGHNHSGGYDQYLGNGSFYLPVGSSLTVVDGKSGTYTDDSISFTYMNYGYLGKLSGSACTHQTMTAFEITGSQVTVKRYDTSGLHQLKAAGVAVSGYNTDTNVIGTEGAVIELGEPVPVVTVTEGNVTVTAAGLTGLAVTKTQCTADGKHNAETYSAYASYDIVPEGYEQGKSATVTITLDTEDGFDASKAVYVIDAEKGTEKKLAITDGTVSFTTNHFSTYSIAQKITKTGSYELATSIEAGESYVIVGNDNPVALMDNDGTLGSMEVTISGDILTSEEELTLWTFSSASSGTITSGNGNKLGYSSSCWNLTGSGDCTFDIGTGNGNFSLRVIRASSGYNRYYFYYDGSDWAKNSSSSASYVRLYKLAEGGSTVEPEEPTPEVPENPDTPDSENEWVALPAGNTYVLDTDGIDNGEKYLIVAKSYAKALSAAASRGNAVDVTINGDTATADAAYGWTFSGSGSSYQISKNGTYLSRSNSSLASSSSAASWTVSGNGDGTYTVLQTGSSNSWWGSSSSYYVRWSNSKGYFQASSSSKDPVRLYKYTGSGSSIGANYIRLGGETVQAYTASDEVTLDTVLGNLKIQTSADGVNADAATVAVTADMVTWNVAFDGNTAGTYIGTVVCEGYTLGTVTVTVTAVEHNYETVTVEATCTEEGSVTTTCTVCGEKTVVVIPATGHDYACVETAATCGADGNKVYTCTKCEDTYTEVIPATGEHTNESVTTEATCTEDGSIVTTCTVCGEQTVEVIEATGHDYAVYTVAPTCTEGGYTTYTCACGDSYVSNETAALGHSYESVVTEATCTEGGYTTYTCACGDSYVSNETAALGHSYESVVTEATCTEGGYTTYTCACGDSYVSNETAALGHSYESVVTEATCTEGGYTTHTCACGDSYVSNETAALGHSYESVVTEATCTEGGYTTHTCAACGDSYVSNETAALGHSYESVVTEATCTKGGYTTHTCAACGDSYVSNETEALGHSYENVSIEATCTEDGYTTHTCVVCDYSYTEVLPALGHVNETVTTEATCTEDGSIVTTCFVCGEQSVEVIEATGHDYAVYTVAPTCTEGGYTTHTCAACGDSYVSNETAALGHSYESVVTEATCTKGGYTTHTCAACGDSYVSNETAALGHSYESVVTEATCTEGGYTTHTCAACGDSYVSNETAALGHSYSTTEADGYLVYTCDNCGHSYSEMLETVSFSKVSSISSDNSYVITLYTGGKYYALSHKDNTVSVEKITVSGNKITSEVTEDLIWDYADSKLSYTDDGTTYYLYAKPASGWWSWWLAPTLTLSTSQSTNISFSNNKLKVGNYSLYYSNGTVSLNSWSATTAYFFGEK